MRVQITVTDDDGKTFEGAVDLTPARTRRGGARRAKPTSAPAMPNAAADGKPDFKLPLRAFLKKHARGSGPKKFAVLLARMTGGKTGTEVSAEAVEREWGRNKGVLGGDFQTMYPTRAREQGWIDSPKRGTFVLLDDWTVALK